MRTHFIANRRSSHANLALALHNKGYHVTGSDDAIFEPSKSRLEKKVCCQPRKVGFQKNHNRYRSDYFGMHAKADNPELLKSTKLGLKIYSYPEFLYEQSKK